MISDFSLKSWNWSWNFFVIHSTSAEHKELNKRTYFGFFWFVTLPVKLLLLSLQHISQSSCSNNKTTTTTKNFSKNYFKLLLFRLYFFFLFKIIWKRKRKIKYSLAHVLMLENLLSFNGEGGKIVMRHLLQQFKPTLCKQTAKLTNVKSMIEGQHQQQQPLQHLQHQQQSRFPFFFFFFLFESFFLFSSFFFCILCATVAQVADNGYFSSMNSVLQCCCCCWI